MASLNGTKREQIAKVLVIGAGTHALTVTAALVEPNCYALTQEHGRELTARRATRARETAPSIASSEIIVLDGAGEWMTAWQRYFKWLEIPTLRSPMLAHPNPRSEHALHTIAASDNNKQEGPESITAWNLKVEKRHGKKCRCLRAFNEHASFLFERPSSEAFLRLCDDVIKRYKLHERVVKGSAVSVTEKEDDGTITVQTTGGMVIRASYVVIATGAGQPRIPRWALELRRPAGRAATVIVKKGTLHTSELINLNAEELFHGKRILIIGGGLTSAQLIFLAVRHGVTKVVLAVRSNICVQEYCVDLAWVGRQRHKLIADFLAKDVKARFESLKRARPGGSMPPATKKELDHLQRHDSRVDVWEGVEVTKVDERSTAGRKAYDVTLSERRELRGIDHIILATGTDPTVPDPLVADLLSGVASGAQVYNGLPVPDACLRLRSDLNIFVTGRYASMQVGPDAGNLSGALKIARLIADAIREDLQAEEHDDDSINDIHDLNNPFQLCSMTSDCVAGANGTCDRVDNSIG